MTREEFGHYLLAHPPIVPPPMGTQQVFWDWLGRQVNHQFGGGRLSRIATINLTDGRKIQVVVVDLGMRRGFFFVDVPRVPASALLQDVTL